MPGGPIMEFEAKPMLFQEGNRPLDALLYRIFVFGLAAGSIAILLFGLLFILTNGLKTAADYFLAFVLVVLAWLVYLLLSRLLPAAFWALKLHAAIRESGIEVGGQSIPWDALKGYAFEGNVLCLFSKSYSVGLQPPSIPIPAYKAFGMRVGRYRYLVLGRPEEVEKALGRFLPKLKECGEGK